jgi:hypothetical protein
MLGMAYSSITSPFIACIFAFLISAHSHYPFSFNFSYFEKQESKLQHELLQWNNMKGVYSIRLHSKTQSEWFGVNSYS